MNPQWWLRLFAFTSLFAAAGPSAVIASLPVPYDVIGCVLGGELVSGRFNYRLLDQDGQQNGLLTYEGNTVRIRGSLTPGDRLFVDSLTVVDENCHTELHKQEFIGVPRTR